MSIIADVIYKRNCYFQTYRLRLIFFRKNGKIDLVISANRQFILSDNELIMRLHQVIAGRKAHMSVEERIRTCLLIEKMRGQKNYCERLGLENISRFHGKKIDEKEG